MRVKFGTRGLALDAFDQVGLLDEAGEGSVADHHASSSTGIATACDVGGFRGRGAFSTTATPASLSGERLFGKGACKTARSPALKVRTLAIV